MRLVGHLFVGAAVLLAGVWALAEVSLHEFEPGAVIRSSEVNENFRALAEAVTDKQKRVTGECSQGSSIRVINDDGTVICHVDQVGEGGEAGVASLNGMTGSLVLRAGSNVSIDGASDGEIVISAVGGGDGGLSAVASDGTLTGDGTSSAPLGLASGAVTADKLSGFGASAGQVLKYDGSGWLAADDEDTTYSAGFGLHLSDNQFSLDTGVTDARYIMPDDDGGLVISGAVNEGSIPARGAGTRLMWYPGESAFRVGAVGGSEWDDDNIGRHSLATGFNTIASAHFSTAMGRQTTAEGDSSISAGSGTRAVGSYSVAMGSGTTANGFASTALGSGTTAGGANSFAIGSQTSANAPWSVAMGTGTTASGNATTAMGDRTIAAGYGSVAMGLGTRAQANHMVAIGAYNAPTGVTGSAASDRPLLVVGNGTGDTNRSHALLLLANGDLRITGPMRIGSFAGSSATPVCRTAGGTLTACSSSARFKEGIVELEPHTALALVEQLRPVSFSWQDSGLEDIGLIAEELAVIEPRLITFDDEGEIEGIKYHHLSAVLIGALQELQAEYRTTVAAHQREIEALEEQVATMEALAARLSALERAFADEPADR